MDGLPMRKWVTADELISRNPCLLIFAMAVTDDNAPADNKIYDGIDTGTGELLVNLQSGIKDNVIFRPPKPVMCYHGLYVDVGSNTEGVFVMWEDLPKER